MKTGSFLVILSCLLVTTSMAYNPRPPRLTVILVIDQFAYHYLNKLTPHLKHGIKFLQGRGVCFTNAHQCNGQPGTATGHANLGTGTYGSQHGFVSNSWYENGKKVACDNDDSPEARVLFPNGVYDYGKSAQHLMVDGLSDQCVLQSKPDSSFSAYSISLKSRSAVATAGKLGKALWIDDETGFFTTSKAYFDNLPEWLQQFNMNNDINKIGSVTWNLMYPKNPYAYNFFKIDNYDYTRSQKSMLNISFPVRDESNTQDKYHYFEKMPQANQSLLDCAQACVKAHVGRKNRNR
jgi:predicted AlkP superfamily pyrophosphatase or phosphodiesterase